MTGLLVRAAGLVAVYLLVLTSVAPGDIALAAVIAVPVVAALVPRRRRSDVPAGERVVAAVGLVARTAIDMVRGSVVVARHCLGRPTAPRLVEIPLSDRSRRNVALWGIVTGIAPDEVVVDVDERRDVLIVHLLDAGDLEAVLSRHAAVDERLLRKVAP